MNGYTRIEISERGNYTVDFSRLSRWGDKGYKKIGEIMGLNRDMGLHLKGLLMEDEATEKKLVRCVSLLGLYKGMRKEVEVISSDLRERYIETGLELYDLGEWVLGGNAGAIIGNIRRLKGDEVLTEAFFRETRKVLLKLLIEFGEGLEKEVFQKFLKSFYVYFVMVNIRDNMVMTEGTNTYVRGDEEILADELVILQRGRRTMGKAMARLSSDLKLGFFTDGTEWRKGLSWVVLKSLGWKDEWETYAKAISIGAEYGAYLLGERKVAEQTKQRDKDGKQSNEETNRLDGMIKTCERIEKAIEGTLKEEGGILAVISGIRKREELIRSFPEVSGLERWREDLLHANRYWGIGLYLMSYVRAVVKWFRSL